MPGPVPNREADLSRPRARRDPSTVVTKGVLRPVTVPDADPEWHPIARNLFDSLKTSGQADFYQDSDWWFAWSLCEDLSHYKEGSKGVDKDTGEGYNKPRSGQMLQAILSAMTNLLVTEGDRRRVKIELTEPPPTGPTAAVTAISDAKSRLAKKN